VTDGVTSKYQSLSTRRSVKDSVSIVVIAARQSVVRGLIYYVVLARLPIIAAKSIKALTGRITSRLVWKCAGDRKYRNSCDSLKLHNLMEYANRYVVTFVSN
jgi:hypothetical protein